jgi:hypothetical protein
MIRSLGKRAATDLLKAMRSYGVTGRVVGQQLHLTNGWRVHYTTGRIWESITKQAGRTQGQRSALVFSSPQTKQVRVMLDIERFAELMGELENLQAQTGRLPDAFTE